jgi:hypothetical protein
VARLYAVTGESFARRREAGEASTVELWLSGSGAQSLAVDRADAFRVYRDAGELHASLDELGVTR